MRTTRTMTRQRRPRSDHSTRKPSSRRLKRTGRSAIGTWPQRSKTSSSRAGDPLARNRARRRAGRRGPGAPRRSASARGCRRGDRGSRSPRGGQRLDEGPAAHAAVEELPDQLGRSAPGCRRSLPKAIARARGRRSAPGLRLEGERRRRRRSSARPPRSGSRRSRALADAGRGDEDELSNRLGSRDRDLGGDEAAHRVADQGAVADADRVAELGEQPAVGGDRDLPVGGIGQEPNPGRSSAITRWRRAKWGMFSSQFCQQPPRARGRRSPQRIARPRRPDLGVVDSARRRTSIVVQVLRQSISQPLGIGVAVGVGSVGRGRRRGDRPIRLDDRASAASGSPPFPRSRAGDTSLPSCAGRCDHSAIAPRHTSLARPDAARAGEQAPDAIRARADARRCCPRSSPIGRSTTGAARSASRGSSTATLVEFFYRYWFRAEVEGIENVPADGGALLVSNHSGALPPDAAMIGKAIREEHSEPAPALHHGRALLQGLPGLLDADAEDRLRRRAPGQRAPAALRRAPARARLPRGPQGHREALQGPLQGCAASAAAASSRRRCAPRRSWCRSASSGPRRRRRSSPSSRLLQTADRADLLPAHPDVPLARAARDARLPARRSSRSASSSRSTRSSSVGAERGRRQGARPDGRPGDPGPDPGEPARDARQAKVGLVRMSGRGGGRRRAPGRRRVLITGLSTYWGGRLAQALEALRADRGDRSASTRATRRASSSGPSS